MQRTETEIWVNRPVATGMSAAAGFGPFGDPGKVNQFCRI
jgi:hypothetical protein